MGRTDLSYSQFSRKQLDTHVSPLQNMNWGALNEIIWIHAIKMDFSLHRQGWAVKTPPLRIFQMTQVYMGSRAETTNWWESFLRVTEILINHIQLMQPDRSSWMQDWMSPRKHPVCHTVGGCPSRNSTAATAGNWIPGSSRPGLIQHSHSNLLTESDTALVHPNCSHLNSSPTVLSNCSLKCTDAEFTCFHGRAHLLFHFVEQPALCYYLTWEGTSAPS